MLKALGRKLRESRKSNTDMSIEEVANTIGTTFSSVAKYERGETMPPIDKLEAMADLYGVSVDYLLGRTSNPLTIERRGMPLPPPGWENLSEEDRKEIKERARAYEEFEIRRKLKEKGYDV